MRPGLGPCSMWPYGYESVVWNNLSKFSKVVWFDKPGRVFILMISARIENEVDGMTLMNDEFDDDTIRRLIPIIKHQVAFKDARKKLRFVNLKTLYAHTRAPRDATGREQKASKPPQIRRPRVF